MGDEVETTSYQVEDGPQINQDELILAQQRQIEKEISESTALVGDQEPIISLNNEYSTDTVYQEKVKDLASKYKSIRKTRPDGNCFFRAFSYANIERLLDNKDEFNDFYKLAEDSKEVLVQLGFQQFTVEDFYDTYMEVLKRLRSNHQDQAADREAILTPERTPRTGPPITIPIPLLGRRLKST
ncbi:hypothetical protein NQ315_007505 [Exocentrus adspersus]|uniref:ubiquitinyl hydrolase 1 n=1 Tax=Exocentrus adspersus TaxID=1586481 RepID=A0AAV8W8N5_9CUCU|nr:hypothetical protein NQ315_007505 [Exocentrus adspersus]